MATIEIIESPFWGQVFSMNDFSLSSTAFSVNLYVKNGENLEPNTPKIQKTAKSWLGEPICEELRIESSSGLTLQLRGHEGVQLLEALLMIHPGRLTWNIIMEVWKIIFLSKWVICRFHVNLPGCIFCSEWWVYHDAQTSSYKTHSFGPSADARVFSQQDSTCNRFDNMLITSQVDVSGNSTVRNCKSFPWRN